MSGRGLLIRLHESVAFSALTVGNRGKSLSRYLFHLGAFALAVILTAHAADAQSIQLRVSSNKPGTAGPVVVVDNGPGDGDATPGIISFNVPLDDWTLVGSAAFGSVGVGNPGELDLSYIARTQPGGTLTSLKLEFSQTGTAPAFSGWSGTINGNFNSAGLGSIAYSAFEDNANIPFSTAVPLGNLAFTTSSQSGTFAGAVASAAPYSLTQVLTFTGQNTGSSASGLSTGAASLIPFPLRVEKSPKNGMFSPGQQVSFTIKVSNPGSTGGPITNAHLVDSLPAFGGLIWQTATASQGTCTIMNGVPDSSHAALDCNLGTIQPLEFVTITVTSTNSTPASACRVQYNQAAIATADGGLQSQDWGALTCAATTLATNNVSPGATVAAGTSVTITVTETNAGGSPISNVFVTGTGCTSWQPASIPSLAPGAAQDFTCTFTPATSTNWTATGHGKDVLGNDVPLTNETTSGTVTVIHPATTLTTKSVSPGDTVEPGTQVTIVVTEQNTGDSTITNVFVTGTGCTTWTPASVGSLISGASQDFTCTFTANSSIGWTATGHGTDAAGGTAPEAGETTSGSVTVIHPATTLTTKTVMPGTTVVTGTAVTITVTEKNTGDSAITNVSVSGSGCTPWTGGASTLAPGASTYFSCTFSPTVTTDWSATGHGTDSLGNAVPETNETTSGTVTVISKPTANCVVINAIQGVAITPVTLTGSGGAGGPYSFTATGLPAGLSISTGGTISGTPTVTGTISYTVTIKDKDGNIGTFSCSVTVYPAPSANCIVIKAIQGLPMTPVTLTASGGAGAPYTFTATGLPNGLSISSSGTISGTPTITGTFSYSVSIKDKNGNIGTLECSLTVYTKPAANCVVINAIKGVPITPVPLTGIGGVGGPYMFTATGLPSGLTMSTSGVISGTPSVTGTFTYTVTVKDKDGNIGTSSCSVTVNPPPPVCAPGTFTLTGSTSTTGSFGNIRLFTATNGIQVKASAFSRSTGGSWSTGYLGSYSSGLGVTNNTESGTDPTHKVDNVGGVDYVLFEFSSPVLVNQAYLDAVTNDSDISVWIGNKTDPFNNHQTLSDSFLSGLGFTEENLTSSSASRWADINNGNLQGNILVISALASDTSPEDYFKINQIQTSCPTQTQCSGAIGDFVWKDMNGNGLQDGIEPGISGVTVQLKSGTTVLATTTTDSNGYYQFTGLCAGTYTVVIPTPPAGYTVSPSLVGSSRSIDSNGSPATVTLPANDSTDKTIDFGFVPPPQPCTPGTFTLTGSTSTTGSFGNIRLFTATNGTQVKASAFYRNTSGGWSTGYLGSYSSGLGVTNNTESGTDPTHKVDNVGGVDYVLFEFSSPVLVNQAYLDAVTNDSDISVWVGNKTDPFNNHQTLTDSFLSGLGFTEENLTSSTASRWAAINGGGIQGNILVIAALASDTSPEDYFKINQIQTACPVQTQCTGKIGDMVWKDSNGNGIQDSGEPGISGVTVQLKSGSTVIATTSTNSSGYYQFTGLCAGSYTVVIPTAPAGYMAAPSSAGSNRSVDSNGSPAAVTLAANNSSDQSIDFGYVLGNPSLCAAGTFVFSGNTPTSGTSGNIRTFTVNGVSVHVSAFARVRSGGAWSSAYLGLYGPGMGVTDNTEGDGSNNRHKIDNIGGTDNYVLFEFSSSVVVNQAFLDSIGADSDITVWIGNKSDPYNNHQTLGDSFLSGLPFTEENLSASSVTSRWADINAGNRAGNVFVLSSLVSDTSPEDEFKVSKLDIRCQ